MISKIFNFFTLAIASLVLVTMQSCDDDDPTVGQGEVTFEITDAPSDDANIQGVFVTVADIKVDGQSVGLDQKQTIELSAYADGQTKLLTDAKVDAKTYSSITLVLDNTTDANGNAPANYVLTTDDTKHQLTASATGTTDITIDKSIAVVANTSEKIVLDFDLRKAIKHANGSSENYQFVAQSDLELAVRALRESEAGEVEGSYQESFTTNSDMVIVYAYHKGDFNQSTETTADENGLTFTNAVTSAVVVEGLTNTYDLHFIEEGDYELAFVAYDKNSTTNQFEFKGLLDADLEINSNAVNTINVEANASVSVSATIVGLL